LARQEDGGTLTVVKPQAKPMARRSTSILSNPGEILATSSSYWRSFALQTAVKLDLFTILGDQKLSGAEVAKALAGDAHGVTTLLNAVAALGLVDKDDDRFSNTEAAKSLLVSSSLRYIGHLIRHHANLAEAWCRLEESVRTGKPVRQRSSGSSGETQADFLRGMHAQAMGIAPRTAESIDLGGRTRLLDLGGGPGTWAIHFAKANPTLTAVVFDLEGSRPYAERTISQFGLCGQVQFHGGDYTSDPLPGGFDVAWLSHILHAESPQTCRALIRKTVDSLAPEGLILVHEFILDPDGTRPLFPALFSLNMLIAAPGGRSYTETELTSMLADAGVRDLHLLDFVGPTESRILAGIV
jgi:SAM-dependent methyltransferase